MFPYDAVYIRNKDAGTKIDPTVCKRSQHRENQMSLKKALLYLHGKRCDKSKESDASPGRMSCILVYIDIGRRQKKNIKRARSTLDAFKRAHGNAP